MKVIPFKFQRSFRGFWVCLGTNAFDTDTFQRAILCTGRKVILSSMW